MNLSPINNILPQNDFLTSQWRISFGLAFGLHLLAFAALIIMPLIMPQRTVLPTVYTVDLYTVAESAPSPAPAARTAQQPPAVSKPEPPAASKPEPLPAPVEETVAIITAPTAAPVADAISLKPIKVKTKIVQKDIIDVRKKIEQVKLSKALDQIKTDIQAKEAQDKAEHLKQEALARIRDAIQSTGPVTDAPPAVENTPDNTGNMAGGGGGQPGKSLDMSGAMRKYYASAVSHIQRHWILPDLQNWDNNLKAVVVVKIRRDGQVAKSYFETQSENIYFNQFVMKTLRDASPLPPFPADLNETYIEIGFIFSPKDFL